MQYIYTIASLNAGTSYTFQLQGKTSSGSNHANIRADLVASTMIAEQIGSQ
jgi:hypothetical protein